MNNFHVDSTLQLKKAESRIAELEAENAVLKERVAMLDVTAVYKSLGEMGYIEQVDKLNARIAELEAAHRWRVVANGELPKNNDYYWAHDDLGQQGMILFYDGEWNKFTNLSYITHWMPLPELPEVEE